MDISLYLLLYIQNYMSYRDVKYLILKLLTNHFEILSCQHLCLFLFRPWYELRFKKWMRALFHTHFLLLWKILAITLQLEVNILSIAALLYWSFFWYHRLLRPNPKICWKIHWLWQNLSHSWHSHHQKYLYTVACTWIYQ